MNKTLALFIGCFIAPILVALLALQFNWLTPGESNFGQFVEGNKKIDSWSAGKSIKWSLVTMESKNCASQCQQNKSLIKNVYDVLGKHNLHVGAFSLASEDETLAVTDLVSAESKELLSDNKRLMMEEDVIYLVDHRGLIVLQYPVSYSEQQDITMKKGLIKDLKKLLNYSRSRA